MVFALSHLGHNTPFTNAYCSDVTLTMHEESCKVTTVDPKKIDHLLCDR